jgi:hypothetical protein
VKPKIIYFVVVLCLLSNICFGSQPGGVYTVVVMEKRGTLTDAEIKEYFELEKYANDSSPGALENLKRALQSMKLYFDKETTMYRRERAFVQSRAVWVESVEISRSEYEQAQQGTDPLEHFPTDRDVFVYAPDMKIQLIKHKSSGFKGISCGVFDDSYSDDPFWLFASDGYVDHLYGKYRMETIHVSSNKIVLGKSNEYAIAELVISMDDEVMQNAKYYINEVLVREAMYGDRIVVDGVQLPKSTRIVHYLGTGSASKDKAIREVTYTLIPSSFHMGEVSESGYPFPYDEDIYCVDYRNGAARDVFLTTNGVVRELRPIQPAETNASPTNAYSAYHYDQHEPVPESTQSRILEAMVLATQAYMESSLLDADRSIALYREILAEEGLADVDRIHCMLGLARACICRGILDSAEQAKMKKAAVAIIQKVTEDDSLDPVLRNIAGHFSMRWEEAKQSGRPQDVIDWFDWMEAIRQLEK